MEKIKWSKKVTNEEVLECLGEKNTLLNNMLCRKADWIGHMLRRNCHLHDAIEGQITEVKEVGRSCCEKKKKLLLMGKTITWWTFLQCLSCNESEWLIIIFIIIINISSASLKYDPYNGKLSKSIHTAWDKLNFPGYFDRWAGKWLPEVSTLRIANTEKQKVAR